MRSKKIIVLKFGSSVLRTPADATRVCHEIYRWVRDGWRVIAVVSALEGETDQLLAEAAQWDARPHRAATALLASTGELRSAALLTLALDRAGIEAQVFDVSAIGLTTKGDDPLDAQPSRLNVAKVRKILKRHRVVVLPGFLGRDALDRTTLLGRGGSDCSALFLAKQLGVPCRLVKDVDGLYEWDPNKPGPAPQRFRALCWDEALKLDGGIVQHKAIDFARRGNQTFEVGSLFQSDATIIGDRAVDRTDRTLPRQPRRVVLLGLGSVGQGVYDLLQSLPELFQVVGVAVRDTNLARSVPRSLLLNNLESAAKTPCDILVELIGDPDPAFRSIRWALQQNCHVVTANKRVVAEHGEILQSLAREHGVSIRWSAAIGGAVPVLEHLSSVPPDSDRIAIQSVLNGTTNFVLDRWHAGLSWFDAIDEARAAGLTESDPARDLNGADAADKLVLIHRQLTGQWISPQQIECKPLDEELFAQWNGAVRPIFRQVASWTKRGDAISARVSLRQLHPFHPLARLRHQENGALYRVDNGPIRFVRGKGAGRWPTAESVIGDLLDIVQTKRHDAGHGSAKIATNAFAESIPEIAL